MARMDDLTITRKPITPLNEFEAYWLKFTPDALDLAEWCGISERQIRDLWRREILAKGSPLHDQLDQWADYQNSLHGNARKASASARA